MATGDPFPWELRPDGLWGFVLSDSSHGFGFWGFVLSDSYRGFGLWGFVLSNSSHGFGFVQAIAPTILAN